MDIKLRPVIEGDCDLLFTWVNDESVRQNAFNTSKISYEEHKKWFKSKLNSNSSIVYICYLEEKPMGQIRIDIEGNAGVISYSIAREFRGKGYGTEVLKKVVDIIKADNVKVGELIGKVKHSNIPSQRAFEKAGYECLKKHEYIEYYKVL